MPDAIPFRTLRLSMGVVLGLGLGGALLVALTYFIGGGEHHERFWHALHFNWLFWASLAMGMVMFAVALHLTNARWAWSIRRFALAGVMFLPVAVILFPLVHWGGYDHYFHHWTHAKGDPIIDAKKAWLSVNGMFWRDMAGITILMVMSVLFARNQLRPDVYGAEKLKGVDDGQRAWYKRLTGNFRGVHEEAAASVSANNKLGVFLGLAYAFLWGMVGIDQAMTMLPHWFSTMFPVAFFMTAFHGGICMTILMVVLTRRRVGIEP
ncbi:MAG TPA: hypothetical protein VK358_18375, partial [Longimicrobium sp.]|nr:hypothetical protein [Longimicrobium sp.]